MARPLHLQKDLSFVALKRYNFILLVLLGLSVSAQPSGEEFMRMLGEPASYPSTAQLLTLMDQKETREFYSPASRTYTIESSSYGISLDFNQNFTLSGIRFYDSGYAFQKCPFELPLYHKLRIHKDYFEERFRNYDNDSSNIYLYRGRFENGKVKVYFRDRHSELVEITADPNWLMVSDQQAFGNWGYRIIPDGNCMNPPCTEGNHTMVWGNGLKLEGDWKYGIPHGFIRFSDSSGMTYSGQAKLGFLWGKGELLVPGSWTYTGDFVMGKRNGQGKALFPNGTRYVGSWLNDKMHGKGNFYYSDRYFYEGEMKEDEIHGKGILNTPEGYIEGSFRKGKPHGFAEQYVKSSQTSLKGQWIDGLKEGKFDLYTPIFGSRTMYFSKGEEVPPPAEGK